MGSTTLAGAGQAFGQSVVTQHRSMPRYLFQLIREPLNTIPTASFERGMVVTRDGEPRTVYLSDPALIQDALVHHADCLEKTEDLRQVLGPALGDGILTSGGSTWRWQRRSLAPAFQHDRLAALLPLKIAAAEATRDRWLALPEGSTVDLGHEMMQTTFKIIIDTMLSGAEGIDAAGVERSMSDYLGATPWMFALALMDAPTWLPYPGRRRALAGARFIRQTIHARVAERRRVLAAGPVPDDLLSMLIAATDPETGRAMTDSEITDNIHTFIAAGHETTAIALSWTFALLGSHPDCLSRLLAEIQAVTAGGPVLAAHIPALTYTRQVVSEAMRLYPPAPLIARSVTRTMTIGGLSLPQGSIVFVPIYAVHRHTGLWTRPEAFDPDRFAPDAVKARHRFAFLPFGAGPRVCIGNAFATMEAIAVLAVLAQAVALVPTDAVLPPPQMRVTLRPARPLRMGVVARAARA